MENFDAIENFDFTSDGKVIKNPPKLYTLCVSTLCRNLKQGTDILKFKLPNSSKSFVLSNFKTEFFKKKLKFITR